MCPAIERDGGDVKALYRRSQALEKLGRLDQAVLDLQRCLSLEPKSRVFQEALRNIGGQIQEKVGGWGKAVRSVWGTGHWSGSDMDSDGTDDAPQIHDLEIATYEHRLQVSLTKLF